MFNDNQIKTLKNELDSHRVKTREKGNIQLSYLEGFDIIETANSIFGFGNWDYAISKLEQVSSEINQNQNNVICYKAIVQVLVQVLLKHKLMHMRELQKKQLQMQLKDVLEALVISLVIVFMIKVEIKIYLQTFRIIHHNIIKITTTHRTNNLIRIQIIT
jgi:hypothetical protein